MATRPIAVVTGSSSGIGKALAEQLAERGYDLVLTSSKADVGDAGAAIQARGGQVIDEIAADLGPWKESICWRID